MAEGKIGRKKSLNSWGLEIIVWGIAVIWVVLFREGFRFLPGAKWLSDVIPLWLVILNLVVLLILTTLLVIKTTPSPIVITVTLIGVLLSWILFSIGFKRFPYVSSIGFGVVILFSLGLKRWRSKRSQ